MRLHCRRDEFEHSPRYVVFEITRQCDPDWSRWCGDESPGGHDELTMDEARQLIDQLADFPKPPTLVLTGGDPLARSDIYSLIEYATAKGLQVNVNAVATPLVTRSALRHLHHVGTAMLSISLDGADAESHDEVHLDGSFDRTLEILADARAVGIATQVNTTLTMTTGRELELVAGVLADHGVSLWSIVFPIPATDGVRLTYEEHEQVYERLWELARHQPFAIKTVSAPHYRRYVMQHQHPDTWPQRVRATPFSPWAFLPSRVNDGRGMMFVGHTGLIHPSDALKVVCGMFPLDHAAHVYQNSPVFHGLRDPNRVEGKCHHCEFRHICGGSRAHAYAMTGNPFAQDPDCKYVPQEISNIG
jgi:radical SAM protein with 4Fe4S-binding SPASM domain